MRLNHDNVPPKITRHLYDKRLALPKATLVLTAEFRVDKSYPSQKIRLAEMIARLWERLHGVTESPDCDVSITIDGENYFSRRSYK